MRRVLRTKKPTPLVERPSSNGLSMCCSQGIVGEIYGIAEATQRRNVATALYWRSSKPKPGISFAVTRCRAASRESVSGTRTINPNGAGLSATDVLQRLAVSRFSSCQTRLTPRAQRPIEVNRHMRCHTRFGRRWQDASALENGSTLSLLSNFQLPPPFA